MRDTCDGVESGRYMRVLTADELSVKREELSTTIIEQFKIQEEFDNIKEDFKERLGPLSKEAKRLAATINSGQEECDGATFKYIDRETGYVGFYDERGNLVNSRRIHPEERQGSILEIRRASNQ